MLLVCVSLLSQHHWRLQAVTLVQQKPNVTKCWSLTVTVQKLQPVMNPVIGLLPARLLNTHIYTMTVIEIYRAN